MSLLIKNGRIITAAREEVSTIYIERETITALGPDTPECADTILDASHCYVIPGGIDVHTHLDAPVGGTTSSDDFETGTRAAAFGGTTCIIDFATQQRGQSLHEALNTWLTKAERATVDYGLHMIIVDFPEQRSGELASMVAAGVTSFKLFMAYPGVLMTDDATILRVMEGTRELGALVCMHAENGTVIQHLIRKALASGNTAPLYHARTRPPITEAEATHRAIALATLADVPIYIVHVTCKESASEIVRAREGGARVFGETCPHYLLLPEAELARPGLEGAKFVLTPPLRDSANHEPLWQSLINGELHIVSTDHCPFFFTKQKLADTGNFTRIPNGGPGIEHRMQLTHHFGVRKRGMPLRRWVEVVSTNPAKLFGLYPRKGTIEVGSDADLVIWNPDTKVTISAASHHMNVDYSMFEGWTVEGNAEAVISRGEIIVQNGIWRGRTGRGQFLKRAPGGLAWQR